MSYHPQKNLYTLATLDQAIVYSTFHKLDKYINIMFDYKNPGMFSSGSNRSRLRAGGLGSSKTHGLEMGGEKNR